MKDPEFKNILYNKERGLDNKEHGLVFIKAGEDQRSPTFLNLLL